MMRHLLVIALLIASLSATHAASVPDVQVDWPAFLARHDLVWDRLPDKFDYGAFLGNGLMGATVYQEGARGLRFEMGRSDVTDHRRDNNRLPIGGLVLTTVGKVLGGTMRVDLWNAELNGSLTTDQGAIRFRAYIHTEVMALILDVDGTGGEQGATFAWVPGHGQDKRNLKFKDPPNPAAITETVAGLPVCIQPRFAGGGFATAWKEAATPTGRRIVLSIADSFPGDGARQEAAATVQTTLAGDATTLQTSHRAWWHALYPKSFVSVPDARLEGFYWIQFYKLASASRPDRVPVDLLGPWFRDTGWPRIWWNLNIQTLYLPVYTANQLALGESFVRFLDTKRANFVRNAKDLYGIADGATVPHTTCYEGLRGDGSCAPDHYINPGDFTWALHDYYLHYRYSMDHTLITDQDRHAFYPLLRGSINVYLSILKKGDDGRLHLPVLHSPEYGNAADNNYNLSLLRWGCQTLIALNKRYDLKDPLLPRWQETLDQLTPYPVDDNGLRIGADMAFSKSHRHWSHMLMVHPLHLMDVDDPANTALLRKSITHWLTVDGGKGVFGWSRAAAASLYAAMGDGAGAIDSIHRHLSDQRFVRPNTMYIEGSPVIECAIVLARSLQDMLLQSHGDLIRVFPAIPADWQDAVFHDLRTEGAFLVSARRQGGRTAWVRVRSCAGEPCRVRPGFSGPFTTMVDGKAITPKDAGNGAWELPLAKDEEALLVADPGVSLRIEPLPLAGSEANAWGLRESTAKPPAPPLGRQVRASSIWSQEFDAAKAVDGDEATRWGAANGSRSGWLEVDLGQETSIGRAVVIEASFPRTREFAIEWKSGDTWKDLHHGTTIAGRKVYDFAPVTARLVRLTILKADDVPSIDEFQILAPGAPLPAAVEQARQEEARTMERTRWFRDARFGMFICWGLYSVPGGSWKGQVFKGRYAEWIEWSLPIPHAEYAAIADTWMPDRFDADAWVKTAKDAGMKYLLLTAKFHDGFLMYPSKITAYNIVDRTPWKRDPVKELAEACARQGLTFGVYWNQAYDWQHPDALTPDAVASKSRNFDRYLDDVCLPQLKEMLTNYPQISFIWFDQARSTPEMTPERSKRFADLIHALRPNLIFNSRLGAGGFHDFRSMGDNAIPPAVVPGVWETAATINHTWGYKATDEDWKSSGQIIFNLVDIVSKGGNYILNVGPMGDGRIPQPSLDVLAGVGAWMQVNGEAIHGAGRTPFGGELGAWDAGKKDQHGHPVFNPSNDWRCTVKPADWSWGRPGKLYVHLFTWPAGGFELPEMKSRVVKAYLLADPSHTALAVTTREARTSIALPGKPAGAVAPVVCVEVE